MRIAIIGAGLAGLTAARALADAGLAPVVFDKSRGLGGRLATRRGDQGVFDHGAPRVPGRQPDLAAYLAQAETQGAATRTDTGWRGLPGMSGLVRPLAQGLDLRRATAVRGIAVDGAVTLHLEGGGAEAFDRVICAVPPPRRGRCWATRRPPIWRG